ncbi:MAG: hypothetical protein HY043_02260, partial [Verrucomicrobia bacterium]|nr:hypothetical protein [Verrucomicrobiota bacterium]
STVPATSVTMDLNHTMTAIYLTPPWPLTVASSNPNSGVSVTVNPNDNNAQGNGNTQFTRTYNNNVSVNLTAPATAGGNSFSKWQRDGVDWATTAATTVTMDANHTMTAIYVTPTRTLTVASSNPNSGVSVTVSPNDNNAQGNGVTQFTRTYNNNVVVNLTAPATASGNNFVKWQRDGVDWATTAATSVTMDVSHTMTAVYAPPIGAGLVGYWKLDDGSGLSALDSSGNGNTGTLVNGPVWTVGQTSGALSFDGVDDYVDAGNGASLNPTTALTLVTWVKASSTSATGGLIVKDNGTTHQYALWLQLGGKVRLSIGAATLTGTTTIGPGAWHLLAGTFDGTQMKIYLDGALEGTLAASGAMNNNGVNVRLGGRQLSNPLTLNGVLDDARIYNRALSQSEIQALLANVPPTVSITAPANGATFTAGANIPISATATDSDGSVSKVDFFANNLLIGTASVGVGNVYSITWNNVAANAYALTAVATDNSNATTTSAPVNITVNSASDPTLVANWKLDDAIGLSALDSSGNGNTGTLVNGPVWSTGATSGALSFDGVNDYVDLGNGASLNPTTAITLVAWVKANSTAATGGLIVKDNATTHQYALWLQAGGKVRLSIGSAVLTGTTPVTTGVWHQLAGTYDGTQLKIYLDGALEGTLAASGTMSNNGVNARLGGRAFTTPLTLNGALDAARIYNRALSQSEIQALTP